MSGFKNNYERKEGSYKPSEVLNFLPNPQDYPRWFNLNRIKKDYDGDLMKMGSQRYYVFRKSLQCHFCDLVGSVMYKERVIGKKGQAPNCGYHFNLYAIDENGNEVLMTKDHVLAKSCGGTDTLDNYVTCCTKCNGDKGSMDYEEFKELKAKEKQESLK